MIALVLVATPTMAQRGAAPSAVVPEIAITQPNRQMDHYERERERFNAASLMAAGRRRTLLREVKADFAGLQTIHNEMLELIQSEKLNFPRLIELSTQMIKRTQRLAKNLALPSTAPSEENNSLLTTNDELVKESFFKLHDALVGFLTNPIFKNIRVFEAHELIQAGDDLQEVLRQSGRIKEASKRLR
jgi:hypothetical protein